MSVPLTISGMPPTSVASMRHAGGGRFEDDVGHAFGPRWDNEAAAEREGGPRRHGAREVDEAADPELFGEAVEGVGIRARRRR